MRLDQTLVVLALVASGFSLHPSSSNPGELPGNWPRAPWTFPISEGFIEFEYYNRRLRDPTHAATGLIGQSLTQIQTNILQTFDPSGDDTWTCRRGVATFEVGLEPDSPASKMEIYDLFRWIRFLTRRWDETPVEIGSAVLFLRGKVRASCSLVFPGIVTLERGSNKIAESV